MSDPTKSLDQPEEGANKTAPTSTPAKSEQKPPPISIGSDDPDSSDLERFLKMMIKNQSLCRDLLTRTKGAITIFVDTEMSSDNLELVEARAFETKCTNKLKELEQKRDDLKQRIDLTNDKKPKAKGNSSLSLTKASLTTQTMMPISSTTGTGSTC